MILYHVTPQANLASILAHGLLLSCARCKPARIWAVSYYQIDWARIHVSRRHHCDPVDTLAFPLATRRGEWHIHRYGLRWCTTDIIAARLQEPWRYEEVTPW